MRWRIIDGLLVSKRGRNGDGYLEIDVRRCPAEEEGWETVHVEVEVASFYPAIATWLTKFVYSHTQSRIHVLVTHGFLRSLARLELEESAVGRFDPRGIRKEKDGSVTVGDTPWGSSPRSPRRRSPASSRSPSGCGDRTTADMDVGLSSWQHERPADAGLFVGRAGRRAGRVRDARSG